MGFVYLSKIRTMRHAFVACLIVLGLAACVPEAKERSFKILDKTFVLPADYKYAGISRPEIPILKILLDIETFENIGSADGSNKPRRLEIQIMPLHPDPEKNNDLYWTKKDAIYKTISYDCVDYKNELSLCKHKENSKNKTNPHIVWGVTEGYSIQDKKSDEYLTVFGCLDKKWGLRTPHCRGRYRLLNNLQVQYQYPDQYSDQWLELDDRIHAHVLSLYKPDQATSEKPSEGAAP